jgi:hypothetical protein
MVDDDDEQTHAPPGDDRRVKDLIAAASSSDELDAQTQADLARWFGLPSFQQVEEGEVAAPPASRDDPDVVARRAAQARATAAVDPVLCDALHARGAAVERMLVFRPTELRILDPSISALDPVLVARAEASAEPREVDLPMGLRDDLAECTPQALLRDLHRPEIDFRLQLEADAVVEAQMRVDPVREVREAMAAHRATERLEPGWRQAREALEPLVRAKREPWGDIRTPSRRVRE